MIPELRARVATTLSSLLTKLTGPQNKKLDVSDKTKFNFKPKVLLNEVLRTFLNFAGSETFVDGVVQSGFHNKDFFTQTARVMRLTAFRSAFSASDHTKFDAFSKKVLAAAAVAAKEDE